MREGCRGAATVEKKLLRRLTVLQPRPGWGWCRCSMKGVLVLREERRRCHVKYWSALKITFNVLRLKKIKYFMIWGEKKHSSAT